MLWWLLLGYSSFVFTVTAVLLVIVLRQLRSVRAVLPPASEATLSPSLDAKFG